MLFEFDCPSCSGQMRASHEHIGAKVRCPHCEDVVEVPDPDDVYADADDTPKRKRSGSRSQSKRPRNGSKSRKSKRGAKSSSGTPWAIVGGLVVTTIGLCVIIAVQFSGGDEPADPQTAQPTAQTQQQAAYASAGQVQQATAQVQQPAVDPNAVYQHRILGAVTNNGQVPVQPAAHTPRSSTASHSVLGDLSLEPEGQTAQVSGGQTSLAPAQVQPQRPQLSAAERAAAYQRPDTNTISRSNLSHLPESNHIDQLILADLRKNNVEPMPAMNDEAFLRRIFLDIVGRIPTYGEAYYFLNDSDPQKRTKLIDNLLNSAGYVSNFYNFWGDILRVRSNLANNVPGQPYMDWIRKSLIENKPYDRFVRELITARGYVWEDGAAGYYLRDQGMPLDNMANTAQIFLGTQLQCAQCHDHPFDVWTQMEFYQMAAFTYGVNTRTGGLEGKVRNMIKDPDERKDMFRTLSRYLRPLGRKTSLQKKKQLRLPDTYQYDDAKPKDLIEPAAIMGDIDVVVGKNDDPTEKYAQWLTSPDNPRFTLVIANRLWKRVMGHGLIEPIDDLKIDTEPSNQVLMDFLEQKMKDYRYDMKRFLRMLYNTQTYQRMAYPEELDLDKTYYFPGPTFRRMTAEQAWDSLVTLVIPMPEERYGKLGLGFNYKVAAKMSEMDPDDILETLRKQKERDDLNTEKRNLERKLRTARSSGKLQRVDALNSEIADIVLAQQELGGVSDIMMDSDDSEMDGTMDAALAEARLKAELNPRYRGYRRDLVRASELQSPAPEGHFVRQFGQSDRELIENSNTDASITQILALLNGPYFDEVLKKNSVLMKFLADVQTEEQKVIVIFLSMLTRMPTQEEMGISLAQIEQSGDRAYGDIIWALLNTRQFAFKN